MIIEIDIPYYEEILKKLNSLRIDGDNQNNFTVDDLVDKFYNLILLYKQTEALKIQNDFLSVQVKEIRNENFRLNERLVSYFEAIPKEN